MADNIDPKQLYEFMGCVNASIKALSAAQAKSSETINASIQQLDRTVNKRVDAIEENFKESLGDVKKRAEKNELATEKVAQELAVAQNEIKNLKDSFSKNNIKTVSGSGAAGAIAGVLASIVKSQIGGG